MTSFYADLTVFLTALMASSLAIIGWGRLVGDWIIPPHSARAPCLPLWVGCCVLISFSELVHLVLPLDWRASIVFFGCGLGLFFQQHLRHFHCTHSWKNRCFGLIAAAAVLVPFVMWVAKSMEPTLHYDVGLYYTPTIQWANETSIVPGLVNLHSRLAYNQSLFSLAALFNFYPYWNHGLVATNLLLFVFTVVTIYRTCLQLGLPGLQMLCVLSAVFVCVFYMPVSPSPDFSVALLQTLIFLLLFRLLVVPSPAEDQSTLSACVLLVVVCAMSITLKLSNLVYAVTSLLVAAPCLFRTFRIYKSTASRTMLLIIILLGLHGLTGYILSGYPLYPVNVGSIQSLPWTTLPQNLDTEIAWIYSWARLPGKVPSDVLGNWDWLAHWVKAFPVRTWVLLELSAIFIFAGALFGWRRSANGVSWLGAYLMYVPIGCALLFWFFTAPDLRFLSALLDLVLVLSCWIFYSRLRATLELAPPVVLRLLIAIPTILALALTLSFLLGLTLGSRLISLTRIDQLFYDLTPDQLTQRLTMLSLLWLLLMSISLLRRPSRAAMPTLVGATVLIMLFANQLSEVMFLKWADGNGWQPDKPIAFQEFRTDSGLTLHVPPAGSDQCWNTPPPCTPYPQPGLKAITPQHPVGFVTSGFFAVKP